MACTKCPEAQEINYNSMPETVNDPFKHFHLSKAFVFHSNSVKKGISHKVILITCSIVIFILCKGAVKLLFQWSIFLAFKVKDGKPDNWERCEGDVEELVNDLFIKWLTTETGIETKVELGNNVEEILVETVQDKHGVSSIGFSSMNKH